MTDPAQTLKVRIQADMKSAMKAGQKERLGAIRLILAAIKQREVDERIELDDSQVLAVLDKMAKQRRESLAQFQQAGRDDLAAGEQAELDVIAGYLPEPLSGEELLALIDAAVAETGACGVRDMGRVMNILRPRIQGRVDMAEASGRVKQRLEQG